MDLEDIKRRELPFQQGGQQVVRKGKKRVVSRVGFWEFEKESRRGRREAILLSVSGLFGWLPFGSKKGRTRICFSFFFSLKLREESEGERVVE